MKFFLIFLQLCLLAYAIFWGDKRRKQVPLRKALRVPNGALDKTLFVTPSQGIKPRQ